MTFYFVLIGVFALVLIIGVETAILGLSNRNKKTIRIGVLLFAGGIIGILATGLIYSF